MSSYRCGRATTSHAAEVFGWRRRGFPPSGVPRGARVRAGCRSPPRQQSTGLGALLGRKSWERPADTGNELRAPLDRLPPRLRRARVPADGRGALAAESEISSNVCYCYGGGARGDASVMALWDLSRPRASRGTKSQKQVQTAKRRNDAVFLDVYGRTTGVWTYRRTNAHDGQTSRPQQGRARVAGLPNKLPTLTAIEQTPSSRKPCDTSSCSP